MSELNSRRNPPKYRLLGLCEDSRAGSTVLASEASATMMDLRAKLGVASPGISHQHGSKAKGREGRKRGREKV